MSIGQGAKPYLPEKYIDSVIVLCVIPYGKWHPVARSLSSIKSYTGPILTFFSCCNLGAIDL